jgi:hypothetical protein
MKPINRDRLLLILEFAPFLIGILFGLLSNLIWNRTLTESILGGIVLTISAEAIWRTMILPRNVKLLWEMKARDIWGEPIGNSFANSDRIAIQHEAIIRRFINELDGQLPGKRGYVGHIFLQANVPLSLYGKWIKRLIEDRIITDYETVNLFMPKEIEGNIDAENVLNSLRDLNCKMKKRIHVLSSSRLRNRYNEWRTTSGGRGVDAFVDEIITEYEQFDRDYAGTPPNSFETYHVFDEELIKRRVYLGEYVVINHRIVLVYDPSTELLQFLIGEEPVKLYSLIFEDTDLEEIPPSDKDVTKRKKQFISYLKRNLIT